jgi:surfactin synthase thioesterase subunit
MVNTTKEQEEKEILGIALFAGLCIGAAVAYSVFQKVKKELQPINIDAYQKGSTSVDENGVLRVDYSDEKLSNKEKGFWNDIQEAGL